MRVRPSRLDVLHGDHPACIVHVCTKLAHAKIIVWDLNLEMLCNTCGKHLNPHTATLPMFNIKANKDLNHAHAFAAGLDWPWLGPQVAQAGDA